MQVNDPPGKRLRRARSASAFRVPRGLASAIGAAVLLGVLAPAASAAITFEDPFGFNKGNSPNIGFHRATTLADIDGDGDKDVVSAYSNTLRAYLITGTSMSPSSGTPVPVYTQHDSPVPMTASRLAAGDFNGDGYEDVASNTRAYLSDGAGMFAAAESFAPGARDADLDAADVNGDGHLDLLLISGERRSGVDVPDTFRVRFGNGDGTFGAAQDYIVPRRSSGQFGTGIPGSLTVADFNGDGAPDLAVTDSLLGVHIYLNSGTGTFGSPTTFAANGANRTAAADLDGDGEIDLIVGASNATILSARGRGDGTFHAPQVAATGVGGPFGVGDFDQDGLLDLAMSGGTAGAGQMFIAAGLGDGTFGTPEPVGGTYGNPASEVLVGDLNMDSRADLTLHDGTFSLPAIALLNATTPADTTPPTITASVAPPANSAGWHSSAPTVSFACEDADSGVASCSDPVTVTTEGADQVITGTATDNAGNSAEASVSVSLDTTLPGITASRSPLANAFGWNNSPVTASFDCSDALSGVAGCTDPVTLSGEGAGQQATGTASDVAGNQAEATVSDINIDLTAPSIGIPQVSGSPFALGGQASFSAEAADGLSGLAGGEYFIGDDPGEGQGTAAALSGTSLTGSISGLPTGVHTLSVRSQDRAGNWSPVQQALVVVYDPSAGFATGGGWIVPGGPGSDPGDLLPGLDGSSKANFGFSVKYQNGQQTVPGGNLNFHYNAGDFRLKSASMDWLVVTNTQWARFQGLAEIDGMAGLHPFRVDARDGANGQPDRFVIRIWAPGDDPDQQGLIYKASGDVEAGQIKIHR